jgi:hypothetical protein
LSEPLGRHCSHSRLAVVSNVEVREEIARAEAKAAGKAEVTVERVLKDYARIAFAD